MMTVSYFEALEAQIPAADARRKMDAAEAALYPQLRKEDAEQLWCHWQRQAEPPVPVRTSRQQSGPRYYWNGQAIDPATLRGNLVASLGAGLSA